MHPDSSVRPGAIRRERREDTVTRLSDAAWSQYLSTFHRERSGITEDVLSASRSTQGITPYFWITAPIPFGARTLDLACGSGPNLRLRPREPWIGLDHSASELLRARRSGTNNVLDGDATSLPFADGSFDAVVCSMALMLIQPLERALAEVHRVLTRGGLFVFTMPGRRPLRLRDVVRYARLVSRLGRRNLSYPNMRALSHVPALFTENGFDVVEDVRTRFDFPLTSLERSALFVRSLYLPGVTDSTIERGERLAARWTGSTIAIPLRRITVMRR